MENTKVYKPGDTIIVVDKSSGKRIKAHIDSINEQTDLFTFSEYKRPQDLTSTLRITPVDNLPCYGERELLKTDFSGTAKISEILRKITVLRMKQWVAQTETRGPDCYLMRQIYASEDGLLCPGSISPSCFCHRAPNPDSNLVACECGRIHHAACIDEDNCICEGCGKCLLDCCGLEELLGKRKKRAGKNEIISLKKMENGFNLVSFGTEKEDKKKIWGNGRKELRLVAARKRRAEYFLREIEKKAKKIMGKLKLEGFWTTQLPRREKKRVLIRDNLLYALVFGLEELKYDLNKYKNTKNTKNKNIRELLSLSAKEQLESLRGLSLAIEANLYNLHASNPQKYTKKARELFMALKHRDGSSLRLDVLSGIIPPSKLSGMTREDLAPNSAKLGWKLQQQRYLDSKHNEFTLTDFKTGEYGLSPIKQDETVSKMGIALEQSIKDRANASVPLLRDISSLDNLSPNLLLNKSNLHLKALK